MIEAVNLRKSYDEVRAVNGVDLSVARGCTMGVIGPNGSGKTTLLRMIATLAKPDCGALRVCGFDALRTPREVRRRISFMPAEASSPLDMTVGEYMRYFACANGVPRGKRRQAVDGALELTDLKGREEVGIRALSTGNRQRLLLAKTLLGEPELLVLDEPAAGLDPRARIEVREFLKELAAMGKTIIISSHILADIESICTDICILEQGSALLSGTMATLREGKAKTHTVVCVRVAEAASERALALLQEHPSVDRCTRDGQELQVSWQEESCNPLLRVLIDADIRILEVQEKRRSLEDIFMESTRGIVS